MKSLFGFLGLATALVALPHVLSGPYYLHVFILTMMYVILSASLRLINLSGQMSLAHGGMATIGAYTSALLVLKIGISFWLGLILSGCFAAGIACIVGYPFVRLKGIYFAIVTVFFGEMIVLLAEQWESLTGGSGGLFGIPRPNPLVIPGLLVIDFSSKIHYYYLALILTALSLVILYAVETSRIGLTLRGIQQTPSLAECVGINTTGYKVLAFALGSFFAGIVGAFNAHYILAIAPDTFGFLFTIYILVYITVGGAQLFTGPIIGAIVLTLLPEAARGLKQFVPFIFAAFLIVVIFFVPDGIAGWLLRLKASVIRNRGDRHA